MSVSVSVSVSVSESVSVSVSVSVSPPRFTLTQLPAPRLQHPGKSLVGLPSVPGGTEPMAEWWRTRRLLPLE